MSTPADQARAMPAGVRRLLLASIPSPVAYVQQHLTANEKLTLAASPYPSTKALFDDCLLAVIDSVLYRMKPDGQVFMRAEFEAVRDRVSGIVMDCDVRDGRARHAHPHRVAGRREGDRRGDVARRSSRR